MFPINEFNPAGETAIDFAYAVFAFNEQFVFYNKIKQSDKIEKYTNAEIENDFNELFKLRYSKDFSSEKYLSKIKEISEKVLSLCDRKFSAVVEKNKSWLFDVNLGKSLGEIAKQLGEVKAKEILAGQEKISKRDLMRENRVLNNEFSIIKQIVNDNDFLEYKKEFILTGEIKSKTKAKIYEKRKSELKLLRINFYKKLTEFQIKQSAYETYMKLKKPEPRKKVVKIIKGQSSMFNGND